jgi:hypothetical protein
MRVSGEAAQEEQKKPPVPVSFRLSTYWKLARGQSGLTRADSRRISLPEAFGLLLAQLTFDECTVTSDGDKTTIVIDWAKVPPEVRNPFGFGVKR